MTHRRAKHLKNITTAEQIEIAHTRLASPICASVDHLVDVHATGARTRRADDIAGWERLEAGDDTPVVSTHAGNDEQRFARGRCTDEPTSDESESFLTWERDHLGFDRITGAIRKLG